MISCLVLCIPLYVGCDDESEAEATEATTATTPEQEGPPALPAGARVMFVSPSDGATVSGPLEDGKVSVHVEMGAENIEVKPAGTAEAGSGHHHIIIDAEATPLGEVVPADDSHVHFGGGQTETDLSLTPGEHVLVMQFADGIHRSYGPPMSARISITVEAEEAAEADEGAEAESGEETAE